MCTIKKISTTAGLLFCLSMCLALPSWAANSGTIDVVAGWNLLGNSSSGSLDVANSFADAQKVITVWKWVPAKSTWAFYSPTTDSGAAYATSKGFDLLTSVNGGEGFWVNASTPFTLSLPTGSPIDSGTFQRGGSNALPPGWSLIAIGDNLTASQFNQTLNLTPVPSGEKRVNITTLWAWDTVLDTWCFYSPSFEALGGTALNDYIDSKGYLNLTNQVITPTMGFWTNTNAALGPAPVFLGSAGNFVILAKAAVSTTGTTAIVGDVGLSPAAASYLTGFGLIADSTNVFSTSSLVTGKLYAADYAVPTPMNMTTAISDMETAFTDAAGRPTPDYTELYAGDISGQTLAPGLYKWGTGVLITGAGVTLSGGANDVWIFQVAQNLTVSNGAIITLSGGAQAKNIFWQVSGEATLGTGADFKGILMSQTLISLNTGAVVNGRLLAQTQVTLDASAVTKPE